MRQSECIADDCSEPASDEVPLGLEGMEGLFCWRHIIDLWRGKTVRHTATIVCDVPAASAHIDLTSYYADPVRMPPPPHIPRGAPR